MKKEFINEVKRMQELAGILNEEDNQTVEDKFEEAGFNFDDGILGGVGSGGAGYYDFISDKISGYNLDKFNEDEFNKWYDNFDIDSFSSFTYDEEEADAYDINIDQLISTLGPGVYKIGEPGYGGYAQINQDGTITLYATPILSDSSDNEFLPIFLLNNDGTIKQEISKEEVKDKLQQNIKNSGSWSLI
jgi:hypothetical protein